MHSLAGREAPWPALTKLLHVVLALLQGLASHSAGEDDRRRRGARLERERCDVATGAIFQWRREQLWL